MPTEGEGPQLVTHGVCASCANVLVSEVPISLQSHLNDLHAPVLAVAGEGAVSLANTEALQLVEESQEEISHPLDGEVFRCIQAKAAEGCSRTIHFYRCVIRNCVIRTDETVEPQVMVPVTLTQGDPDDFSPVTLTVTSAKRGDFVRLMIHSVE